MPKLTGLTRDLAGYLRFYNEERAHTGRLTAGRTPLEALIGAGDRPEDPGRPDVLALVDQRAAESGRRAGRPEHHERVAVDGARRDARFAKLGVREALGRGPLPDRYDPLLWR